MKTVSTWSSAVWPSAMRPAPVSRATRAERGVAGQPGGLLEGQADTAWHVHPDHARVTPIALPASRRDGIAVGVGPEARGARGRR